jgi:hypothetical protein
MLSRFTFFFALPLLVLLCVTVAIPARSASAKSPSSSSAQSSTQKSAKGSTSTRPSAAEIAAAKASGKVWVNLTTGVYHRGGRWYGKTKNGKFVTPEEAKKAGYKPSKRD